MCISEAQPYVASFAWHIVCYVIADLTRATLVEALLAHIWLFWVVIDFLQAVTWLFAVCAKPWDPMPVATPQFIAVVTTWRLLKTYEGNVSALLNLIRCQLQVDVKNLYVKQ